MRANALGLAGFRCGQLVAIGGIARRNIKVERHQVFASVVTNFVFITVLDEKQPSWDEPITATINNSRSSTSDHQEPLVGAAMPILRATFGITGRQDHLRGLRSPVSQNDIESLAETKSLMLHAIAGWS